MKKTSEPISFFGSGPVAASSLELLASKFNIEAVFTKPRPAHHKGPVPVIELAERLELPLYTASTKKELDDLFETRPVKSRSAILIDFGIIVSQEVIDYFELGIINSHFSLLPEWRGADPITFSILSGQKRTGISLMLLTAGMDEGPLLAQAEYFIDERETTPSLTEALIELSHKSLESIVPLYLEGQLQPAPQDQATIANSHEPSYSRKLSKQDSQLDPTKTAAVLEREIRAFLEWPKSKIKLGDVEVTILESHVINISGIPGSVSTNDNELTLHCSEGSLVIDKLKPAGKQTMTGSEFLRGYSSRI